MKKAFSFAAVAVLALAFSLFGCGKSEKAPTLTERQKLVEGAIVDIYNDAAAGEAYVTLTRRTGSSYWTARRKALTIRSTSATP